MTLKLTKEELELLLERACLRGDSKRAGELLEAGAPLDFIYGRAPSEEVKSKLAAKLKPSGSERPLNMDYLGKVSPSTLRELLGKGVDARQKTETVLLAVGYLVWNFSSGFDDEDAALSATQDLLERIDAFAEAGASVEAPQPGWRSPLMDAVRIDALEGAPITRRLLSWGADPNRAGPGQETALHVACRMGRLDAAVALIKAGANELAKDELGRSPTSWALIDEGALRGAFLSAVEERDLKAALPEAKKSATPRM